MWERLSPEFDQSCGTSWSGCTDLSQRERRRHQRNLTRASRSFVLFASHLAPPASISHSAKKPMTAPATRRLLTVIASATTRADSGSVAPTLKRWRFIHRTAQTPGLSPPTVRTRLRSQSPCKANALAQPRRTTVERTRLTRGSESLSSSTAPTSRPCRNRKRRRLSVRWSP